MRVGLIIVGALVEALGWLFALQGLGIIRWPASSSMIDQRLWVAVGAAMVVAGTVLLLAGLRRRV